MIDDTQSDISMDDIKAFCIGMNMTKINDAEGNFPDAQ